VISLAQLPTCAQRSRSVHGTSCAVLVSRLHHVQALPSENMTFKLFRLVFLVCWFAQASTGGVLPSRDPVASLPLITKHRVDLDPVVDSGAQAVPVCYSCFFKNDPEVNIDKLVSYFRSIVSDDPIIRGDARFIVWRATDTKDCGALDDYRRVTGDADRLLTANVDIAFSAWECGFTKGPEAFDRAAHYAAEVERYPESRALHELSTGQFDPEFGDSSIETSVLVPRNAKWMVLGESYIPLTAGMRVGTQVERVYRDWLGTVWDGRNPMSWDLTRKPVALPIVRDDRNRAHHEGALVEEIQKRVNVNVTPLFGTLIARNPDAPDPDEEGQWYAPDEKGVFRFKVLMDKVEYPTTHVFGNVGWITDTHGISAVVSQALEYKSQLVIGCGDYEGKIKAAYYLATKGVNVAFPGDRFEDLLIGYKGKGTLIGTAPVHRVEGMQRTGAGFVIGLQPVKFSLSELIVAEDTTARYPTQYYDAPARYFRQLSSYVPLNIKYVAVDDENQLDRVLNAAASVVAVRIRTDKEDAMLRQWLLKSPQNRAVLFHSGLYQWAQGLFTDFPLQVTFGDLHPRFE
jgi:hypothetical protein